MLTPPTKSIKTPILITGATGMLGTDLVRTFAKVVGREHVLPMGSRDLDICNYRALANFVARTGPGLVINAAAYTNVDGAESEREDAFRINVTGPSNLARVCDERKIKLVHFSTDQVFSGVSDRPWKETDKPAPSNYYAYTKFLGEEQVLRNEDALVIRVQWLYGDKKDRFTPLKDKEVFTPFDDQFGAPTWTHRIAEVLVEMIRREARGIFHIASDDYASWAEVYEFVRSELKLSVQLKPRHTEEVRLPANRPLYAVLSNDKLKHFLGVPTMGSWKDSLREFLRHRGTIDSTM